MTEAEWLACTDPLELLAFLGSTRSERKQRLYLCNGCRSIWAWLYARESRSSVEVGEQYADGLAGTDELRAAHYIAEVPTFGTDFKQNDRTGRFTVQPGLARRLGELGILPDDAWMDDPTEIDPATVERLMAAAGLAEWCSGFIGSDGNQLDRFSRMYIPEVDWPGRWMVDCMFGNPFRPVSADARWLTSSVLGLAATMYESRESGPMPILADALEEAGCDSADILSHCRGPGPHVRGCWVIDLVLGKK